MQCAIVPLRGGGQLGAQLEQAAVRALACSISDAIAPQDNWAPRFGDAAARFRLPPSGGNLCQQNSSADSLANAVGYFDVFQQVDTPPSLPISTKRYLVLSSRPNSYKRAQATLSNLKYLSFMADHFFILLLLFLFFSLSRRNGTWLSFKRKVCSIN